MDYVNNAEHVGAISNKGFSLQCMRLFLYVYSAESFGYFILLKTHSF